MDIEKLKQWMEVAQNMNGGDFWKNIFDQDFAGQFMNDNPSGKSVGKERAPVPTFPLIEIAEGAREVIVTIELPGVKKENIELGLSGKILTVKGTNLPPHPDLKQTYTERFYGDFQRQITLPDTISPQDLTAKFWNGLLLVSYQRSIEKVDIIPID